MKWLKINFDDSKPALEYIELPEGSMWLSAVYRELNCDSIEVAQAYRSPWVLVVDELGKCKEGWESRINTVASILYCSSVDCIVGDCIICQRYGSDLMPLSQKDCDTLFGVFS